MIITRTPLRLSFVGGGSDLPSYYENKFGAVISTAIDKYVYINLHSSFSNKTRVAYSQVEEVTNIGDVKHPLVRNSAKLLSLTDAVEITSIADIPANGTGLGSSSAFTVGLINAISNHQGEFKSKEQLAQLACAVEIELCGEPIGKQDQYASAYGGFNYFRFNSDSTVDREKIHIDKEFEEEFFSSLMVFYTGIERKASDILKSQNANNSDEKNIRNLHKMVQLVPNFKSALNQCDLKLCGEILNANWELKKELASDITNFQINEIYDAAISAGAYGGKLLGAGAGGFMAFLAPKQNHKEIREALKNLSRHYWRSDKVGSTVIYNS